MKSNPFHYLLILFLSLTVLTGCKDDDEPTVSNTEKLTSNTWQGDAVIALGTDVSANPQFLATFPDIKTMTLDFRADGTYTANYRRSGVPTTTTGEWEFRNNETVLYLDLEQLRNYELTIDELSEERLELTTVITYNTLTVPAEVQFVAK